MVDEPNELIRERLKKLENLRALGVNPYVSRFCSEDRSGDLLARHGGKTAETLTAEEIQVRTAGRLMAIRTHGKITFAHLRDGSGQIQVYLKQDAVGPAQYDLVRRLDVGDFVGVEGHLFRTRTGELTIWVSTSVSPCHFSGRGRKAFVRRVRVLTQTVSSPVRVRNRCPSTPTKSPTSRRRTRSYWAGPTASCFR